jgi:very-short-patch-repair endonuclease
VVPGDLRGDCTPLELQRRLGNLRRRDREWREEQGLNVLFLALGFLEWIDADGETARSPLLLLPAELDRASPRDSFSLRLEADDLTTNATLAVRLREFGIELPQDDGEIETAGGYLDLVRQVVAQRPGWKVHDDVCLAIFAYSKLAMWRDLELIKNNGTDHPIVLALAGAEPPMQPDNTPRPSDFEIPDDLAGGRLDDVLEVRDQFGVLPTDYSQLLAVTAARSGHNLVVHGPPGTGKSQTIANIIATFLAEGKSVLFVSEKTAALDVVKRRLDEKDLGVFCLDLHSERGSKASVYQQLRQSVDDPRTVRRLEFDYTALAERRRQLNRVVRALHQVREPLSLTAFQAHGSFALLRDVPHVGFALKDIAALDQESLARTLEAADRVALRQREFQEHWSSHWRVLREGAPPLELANNVRRDMLRVAEAVSALRVAVPEPANALGLKTPATIAGVIRLEQIARHLAQGPGVPAAWLKTDVPRRLRRVAEREGEAQRIRRTLEEQVTAAFGSPVPAWDFGHIVQELVVPPEERRTLAGVLGDGWPARIIQNWQATSRAIEDTKAAVHVLQTVAAVTAEFVGVSIPQSWPEAATLASLVGTISSLGPVPSEWVQSGGPDRVVEFIDRTEEVAQQLDEAEAKVLSEFEPGILEVVDRQTLARYRTDHQSWLRRLVSPEYRSDRRALRSFRRVPAKLSFTEELKAVEDILRVRQLQARWNGLAEIAGPLLGNRNLDRTTDWDSVRRALEQTKQLRQQWSAKAGRLDVLLTGEEAVQRCRDLGADFADAVRNAKGLIEAWLAPGLKVEVATGNTPLAALEEMLGDAFLPVRRLETAAAEPLARASAEIQDVGALRELMQAGARLVALEKEHQQRSAALQTDFGERFRHFDTDWQDILDALTWTDQLLGLLQGTPSTPLLEDVEQPDAPSRYNAIADSLAQAVQRFRSETEPMRERYDFEGGPWEAWDKSTWDEIIRWTSTLASDADSASDWLQYRRAVANLDNAIGESTTEQIRQRTDDSTLVPRIVERRLLGAWLDRVYQQEPILAGFAAAEQEDLMARFERLDEQSTVAAQVEVRRRVFERYPPNANASSSPESALGILRGQLARRRRQWPVRRLLRAIPNLIQRLKPCVLVSPLAASQYLPLSDLASETLTFDVVIFDEASQVFPEDAVPAVLRGRQLVLAGDQKQLPPSNYFRRSMDDDDDSDDDADDNPNQLAGMDSILDASVGTVARLFHEAHLNVHYRSRDENLIRFSNHYFYGNRLLTFPSPGVTNTWQGVFGVYVPDGRYDAGATRTNRKEAERVADLVFQHMRTRPLGETLGVVALSRAQADLIERLLDERRILERDVDVWFDEETPEPFFVKNLENVQGDERDHMIISIGYGPTVGSGAVPNRFGPLNIPGGERRLNVVVTRARQRVDLVHSLRASDIRAQGEGPRLLRRYLEYVGNPTQAFEAQVSVDPSAEPESPFEEAVERALVAKGYRVARQVGVSGYRIDLAIMSEDGNRYDLGIECDGWAYHNAPAARDRDWLRQKVLEGLGWTIHRVWSTAWARNPEAELARIEAALAAARARATNPREQTSSAFSRDSESSNPGVDSPTVEVVSNADLTDAELVQLFGQGVDSPTVEVVSNGPAEVQLKDYVLAELPTRPSWAQLQFETTQNLVQMISFIAEVEGPVHKDLVIERIRTCYGMGRVRGSTRERVEHAILDAQRSGRIKTDGTFIWTRDDQLNRAPRKPIDGNNEHVPPTELQAVVLGIVRVNFAIARLDLVVETARVLGFARTGSRITEVVDAAVQALLDEGKLVESFGMLRPSE